MRTITIKEMNNGYLINSEFKDVEGYKENELIVIEEGSSTEDDIEDYKTNDEEKICLGRLLYKIAELLGEDYNKWNADNLNIKFNKTGHKYEE